MKDIDRKRRQIKLANLFFEMGMDIELVEKVSGVSKEEIVKDKTNIDILTFDNSSSSIYLENKNSY